MNCILPHGNPLGDDNTRLDTKHFTPFARLLGYGGGTNPNNRSVFVLDAISQIGEEKSEEMASEGSFYFWSGYGESLPKGKAARKAARKA